MSVFFILSLCSELMSRSLGADYVEAYFDQTIDHFNFESFGNRTFKQRYLYNDSWWERGRGPIFFYAGNEVPIEGGWNKNGFITEMAPSHRAFVLFVEHRYYGKSLPFGEASFNPRQIEWLSVEQALADYAFFLTTFKKINNAGNCPVIAFGASYGGILTAFMRFKYPNVIQGSISASAPIYQLEGKTSSDEFFQTATKTFRQFSANCEAQVRVGYKQLDSWVANQKLTQGSSNCSPEKKCSKRAIWPDIGNSSEKKRKKGLKRISQTFRLCNKLKSNADYDRFLRWTRNAFGEAAQKNYPFPTETFPAFPVKVMCERLDAENSPVNGLRSAVDLYYNATGNSKCFDLHKEFIYCGVPTGCVIAPISKAWDYQACTQLNLQGGSNGETDMFPILPFTSQMRDEHCRKTWDVIPRRNWLETVYWGEDISLSSNIVFSNGDLDPWSAGGVLHNISDSIRAIVIEGGAHHLDLWAAHPNDPQAVIDARNFEVKSIQRWINEYHAASRV